MKINKYILPIVLICASVFMSSCNINTDDTSRSIPNPTPPVVDDEQRLISMIKMESNDGDYTRIYYFAYDDLDRIDNINIECNDDDYPEWVIYDIVYVSDDHIKVIMYEDNNDFYEYDLFLNEDGYIALKENGDEYIYDNNGYLIRGEYTHLYYGVPYTDTYDIQWSNGNIFSIFEKSLYGTSTYYMQSNNKKHKMVNIDLSRYFINDQCGFCCMDNDDHWGALALLNIWGTPSNNHLTSLNYSYEGSNGSYSSHSTYDWSYDNDGYPRLCRESTDSERFYLYEISYIDETGELDPSAGKSQTQPNVAYTSLLHQ